MVFAALIRESASGAGCASTEPAASSIPNANSTSLVTLRSPSSVKREMLRRHGAADLALRDIALRSEPEAHADLRSAETEIRHRVVALEVVREMSISERGVSPTELIPDPAKHLPRE